MKEICKLKGYENVNKGYYITTEGDVLSYRDNHGNIKDVGRKLKLYKKTGGYLNTALTTIEGKTKYARVNRLVALAFIDNPDNKPYVNHIDEVRTNNNVNNLEWVTASENNLHSLAKKVYMYNFSGDLVNTFASVSEIKLKYPKVNLGHVATCCRDEIRNYANHIFSYKPKTKREIVQRLSKPYYLKGDNKRK